MLNPTGEWSVTTPPELGPYGWTTTDLWIAPAASALFATLTHAQPFWIDLQRVLLSFLSAHWGYNLGLSTALPPMSMDDARSVVAILISMAFAARAWKTYGGDLFAGDSAALRPRPKPSAIAPKKRGEFGVWS
jgi:hypothetical protein